MSNDPIPQAEYCTAVVYFGHPGSNARPPEADELCDEYALEDSEYCERHQWMEGE